MAVCPVLIALAIPAGHEWRMLLAPERHGILVARLWRVLLGALVGASLSVAGASLQAVLRNPLADPYVLGLSAGAGLGTALAILAGGAFAAGLALPLAGFAGALMSLLIVYLLARTGPRTSPQTLILAGVVWGSLCGGWLMLLLSRSTAEGLHAVMWWFLGDLQVLDARLVLHMAGLTAGALFALSFFARDMNVLLLGDQMAGHVGLEPERTKRWVLLLAAVLTGGAVAVSGLIGFVGLVVPHALRALVGPDHRRLLPAAALGGAAFLTVADGLGRLLFYPVEMPAGVITSLVGAPFFLWLLRHRQQEIWR